MPNASPNADVPKNFALVISRTNPRILEQSVRKERDKPLESNDFPAGADPIFDIYKEG